MQRLPTTNLAMNTSTLPDAILDPEPVEGLSSDLLLVRQDLAGPGHKPVASWRVADHVFDLVARGRSLWVIVSGPGGLRVAFRAGYCPDGTFADFQWQAEEDAAEFWLTRPSGQYRVRIELADRRIPVLHWTTWFAPAESLRLMAWPRDVYPIGEDGDPMASRGVMHVSQKGPRTGLLYASSREPGEGSWLYFQNLTSLNAYFEATHTAPLDCVGGQWPELGFALPISPGTALPAKQELILSDAYVSFSRALPEDEEQVARQYLDLLAQVYLRIPRPPVEYRHWPDKCERALHHLTHSPLCTREIDGRRYVNPYVGATGKPPESMVQLSVLVALRSLAQWQGESSTLLEELNANLASFYDPELGTVLRWLRGEPFTGEQVEAFSNAETMDSWYLYHVLSDLGHLAKEGDPVAKGLFLDSLDYAISVAHRFDYRWPVFFDLKTLEVRRAESSPGAGGQNDVGGLYARVMLLAWELTRRRTYLDEAIQGGRRMDGLGFNLAYQLNNTVLGALAMLQIWKATGDRAFLNRSFVCIANLFAHVWLWQCRYGTARYYNTFFGILPLKDAPYLALFEEFEVPSVIDQYLALGGDAIPRSARLLLADLLRHSLARAWQYYPAELPPEIIAPEPKTGQLARGLEVPLEDFYEGWQKPGLVGQEVYGAGAPFTFVARHYHRIVGAPFMLYCDYPLTDLAVKRKSGSITITFRLGGDARLPCRIRLVPIGDRRLAQEEAQLLMRGRKTPFAGAATMEGHLEFEPNGAGYFTLAWTPNTSRSRKGESSSRMKRRRPNARSAHRKA